MPNSSRKYYLVTSRTRKRKDDDGNEGKVELKFKGAQPREERFFIPVSEAEKVRFSKKNTWVKLRNMDGDVKVSPAWSTEKTVRVNGKKIPLVVKEIETHEELKAYRALTKFHYRGNGTGRCIPLIATLKVWNLPEVVGFVELSSSMIVGVARKKLLDTEYSDSTRGYRWKKWDYDTAKKYTNAMVRISRCVVYPELRGIGLAAELTEAAVAFAAERWHVGGLRPCFIEIIAEMLRYWPFVEKAGFVKIGETEGNAKRAPKAMKYLLERKEKNLGYPQGGGGIMSMHRMHADKLVSIQEKQSKSVDDIVKLLSRPSHKLSKDNWLLLHDIYRPKKPVYMRGLTKSAEKHLRKHSPPSPKVKCEHNRSGEMVSITNLKITACATPQNTERCRKIQEAFGIVIKEIKTELISDFSMEFNAGEVILVTGASGVGKSLFLRAIRHAMSGGKIKLPYGVTAKAKISKLGNPKLVHLQKPAKSKSPIELLKHLSLDDAMKVLAQSGLAEANLFVRPSGTLSAGQNYRLALAVALSKEPDIMLIDEFGEPLDEYTATVICRKTRKITRKTKMTAVVATADARNIVAELQPDRTLLLLANGGYRWC